MLERIGNFLTVSGFGYGGERKAKRLEMEGKDEMNFNVPADTLVRRNDSMFGIGKGDKGGEG